MIVTSSSVPAEIGLYLAALEQTWSAAWSAAGEAEADKDAAMQAVAASLSPDVADRMSVLLGGEIKRFVDVHPVLTENDDGTVEINDCLYISPAQVVTIANWYQGLAELDGNGGWLLTSLESRSLTGCIPALVAEEVFADRIRGLLGAHERDLII